MAVLSYLKASVCLVILVSLSPSTHPAIPFDCPKACVSSKGQTALDSCISRCNQIVGFVTQRYPRGNAPVENEDDHEDPTDGLISKGNSPGKQHRLSDVDDIRSFNWKVHLSKHKQVQIGKTTARYVK